MNKRQAGYRIALLSIIINILLFCLKYWAAIKSHSLALRADAWHTLSDSLTSLILVLGFRLSARPPDSKHPFGHGRAEVIASVIIGTILLIIGFNFFAEAIRQLHSHESASFGRIALTVTIISILTKEILAQIAFHAARIKKSELIRADGWHHRSDALSSLIILVGIIIGRYFWWIDSLLSLLVALLIFKAGYDVIKKASDSLLGEQIDESVLNEIRDLIPRTPKESINIHHLHYHCYGDHKEITFHIEMPGSMKLDEVHKTANNLENAIRDKLQIEATIHVDPI